MADTRAVHCFKKSNLKKTAQFISQFLHPIFMPIITLAIIFYYNPYVVFNIPKNTHSAIFAIVAVYTILIPLLSSILLKKLNFIESLEMESSNERRLPFLISGFSFFFCCFMLQKYPALILLSFVVLGASIAMLLTIIINFRYKISAHMIGIGGLVGTLTGLDILLGVDYRFLIVLFIFISGILGSARLLLGAHKPGQVYLGFMIGFLSEFVLLKMIQSS